MLNFDVSTFDESLIVFQYAIAPVVIGAIASLASAGMGLASQYFTNKKNKEAAEEANDIVRQNNQFNQQAYLDEQKYNRELQERMFQREDTAYQRTADDLQKAGYSPLAINGTNNAGSVVGQAQMPELSAINPFQQDALNFGQLADIIGQADSRMLQERALDIQEEKNLSDKEQKELDRKENIRQFDITTEQKTTQFNQTMEQTINQFESTNKKDAEKLKIEQAKLDEIQKASRLAQTKQDAEEAEKALKRETGGRGHTERYTNYEEYKVAIAKWRAENAEQLEKLAEKLKKSTSESGSGSESGNAGINILGNGINGNHSQSSSYSESWSNLDESAFNEYYAWLEKNAMPVYY